MSCLPQPTRSGRAAPREAAAHHCHPSSRLVGRVVNRQQFHKRAGLHIAARRPTAAAARMATGAAAAALRGDGAAAAAAAAEAGDSPSHPFVLGLTGSIGMGKSTVSAMFQKRGVPVVDADALVHQLYAQGGAAVAPVGAAFPSAIVDGAVSRPALGAAVVGDEAAMKRLEGIVHPLVEAARLAEMRAAAAQGAPLIVLDIPLLYETGGEAACDAVAVVSAPAPEQRARVLARPGMTPEKFEAILGRQVPDAEKRRRADCVIDTGAPLADTDAAVGALVEALSNAGVDKRHAFARALQEAESKSGREQQQSSAG